MNQDESKSLVTPSESKAPLLPRLPLTFEKKKIKFTSPVPSCLSLTKQLCFLESLLYYQHFRQNALFDCNLIPLMLNYIPRNCQVVRLNSYAQMVQLSRVKPIIVADFSNAITSPKHNSIQFFTLTEVFQIANECRHQDVVYFFSPHHLHHSTRASISQINQGFFCQTFSSNIVWTVGGVAKWIDDICL
jgi:hypothetical protein